MPKTPNSFFTVVEACRNLLTMHDNMRTNVQILQQAQAAGTLTVPLEQALQDLGKAFQQRLAMHDAVVAKGPLLQLTPSDIASVHAFLKTHADALATAKDEAVIVDVLANVPAVVSPF